MSRADYSERHYELAINLELVRASNQYFVPSQNEEKALGYDIALVPALPPLWASLTRGLSGMGAAAEPRLSRATSLFLQYKRPEHVSNRNGKESSQREAGFPGSPVSYYRFQLEKDQLKVLLDLQDSLAGRASVCYAAGIFHKREDFYSHKMALDVASNSTFLRLDKVRAELLKEGLDPANPADGHCWTYGEDGRRGLLCSEPRPVEGLTFEELRASFRESVEQAEPLEEHVDEVRSRIGGWRSRVEADASRRRLPLREDEALLGLRYDRLQRRQFEPAQPAVASQQLLDELGIGWFLAVPVRPRQG